MTTLKEVALRVTGAKDIRIKDGLIHALDKKGWFLVGTVDAFRKTFCK